jgi:hypothetical protein
VLASALSAGELPLELSEEEQEQTIAVVPTLIAATSTDRRSAMDNHPSSGPGGESQGGRCHSSQWRTVMKSVAQMCTRRRTTRRALFSSYDFAARTRC